MDSFFSFANFASRVQYWLWNGVYYCVENLYLKGPAFLGGHEGKQLADICSKELSVSALNFIGDGIGMCNEKVASLITARCVIVISCLVCIFIVKLPSIFRSFFRQSYPNPNQYPIQYPSHPSFETQFMLANNQHHANNKKEDLESIVKACCLLIKSANDTNNNANATKKLKTRSLVKYMKPKHLQIGYHQPVSVEAVKLLTNVEE